VKLNQSKPNFAQQEKSTLTACFFFLAERVHLPLKPMQMFMRKNKQDEGHIPLDDYTNYYYTNDIDVASMLVCKGYNLKDVVAISHNKATFVFKNHTAINDAVDGFWSNRIEVRPLEFANARKNLKSRIYGMRKGY
jgi:hypothetical protein